MKTWLMAHREGFCTGTAKSVSRYDIYLEWIAVYQYIGISLHPYVQDRQNSSPDLDPNNLTL